MYTRIRIQPSVGWLYSPTPLNNDSNNHPTCHLDTLGGFQLPLPLTTTCPTPNVSFWHVGCLSYPIPHSNNLKDQTPLNNDSSISRCAFFFKFFFKIVLTHIYRLCILVYAYNLATASARTGIGLHSVSGVTRRRSLQPRKKKKKKRGR